MAPLLTTKGATLAEWLSCSESFSSSSLSWSRSVPHSDSFSLGLSCSLGTAQAASSFNQCASKRPSARALHSNAINCDHRPERHEAASEERGILLLYSSTWWNASTTEQMGREEKKNAAGGRRQSPGEGYDDVQKTENTRLNSNLSKWQNGALAAPESGCSAPHDILVGSFVSPFVPIGSCLIYIVGNNAAPIRGIA